MEHRDNYITERSVITLYDILSDGTDSIHIKEIFDFNNKTYISYDYLNKSGLITEEITKFLELKQGFLNSITKTPLQLSEKKCGCNEINTNI